MRTSTFLLTAAAFIATTAISAPAESKPVGGVASQATTDKCKKVGDECLKSPLCHSSNYAMRQQCEGRCINRQSKCLGYSPRAERAQDVSTTKEGKDSGKGTFRAPIAKPAVQQPTKTLGAKSVPLRGGRGGGYRR